jgi:hypothetical protein
MAVERPAAKRRKPLMGRSWTATTQPRATMPSRSTRWSARAGMLGGLLWVLFPLGALPVADLMLSPQGSLVCYGLGYLLAQLLLLGGLGGLRAVHGRSYGWLGNAGFYVSLVALALMFVGGAFEMVKLTSTGAGTTVGYLTLIVSFLLLAWGSVFLGLAITVALHDPPSYLAGLLLAIGVPLGFLAVFEAGASWTFYFWAGLTVPYGVAWLLLGYALLSARATAAKPSRFG